MDIGYSAVKGFAPNKVFCFPAFAKKVTSVPSLGTAGEYDIVYTDMETGEIWLVGEAGQKLQDSREAQSTLYGRNRYFSPVFRIISAVGLGIGLLNNEFGKSDGRKPVIQTGLPPAYIKGDTSLIKEALSGHYHFTLKIGSSAPVTFDFYIEEDSVHVMPQPMGTLFSIATASNGQQILDAKKYFASNMLILDPGFGTLDIFNIRNRYIESYETYDDLGMRAIFERTVNEIYRRFNTEISVPALQMYLESGEITVSDRRRHLTEKKSFASILQEQNEAVCKEALGRLDTLFDNLVNYDYLVVTGGTGAAWLSYIKEYYKGMQTLQIIPGTQNDSLSSVYANVRGYYLYMYGKVKRGDY